MTPCDGRRVSVLPPTPTRSDIATPTLARSFGRRAQRSSVARSTSVSVTAAARVPGCNIGVAPWHTGGVIDLPAEAVEGLPVDQLGLAILADLVATKEWNEYNYLNGASNAYQGEALNGIAEALAWLRACALIARKPGQTAADAIMVTRTGRRVVAEGPTAFYATERLQGGVHPLIEERARPQFLIGQYELGVFASMKAVEVRVRALGKFGDELVGVDLMNQAFGMTGRLTDPSAVKGEQEGARAMFVGAYAVLRNPSGHREVNYDDVAEAAEAVHTASLLMRILDRVEARREVLDRELIESVSEHLTWANSLLSEMPDSQPSFEDWRDRAGAAFTR